MNRTGAAQSIGFEELPSSHDYGKIFTDTATAELRQFNFTNSTEENTIEIFITISNSNGNA